ncbi:hypothetical protein J2X43_003656 [Rhizobium sp. BE258]|nr:hypothetical protein [Rhizobium sp. BE258]
MAMHDDMVELIDVIENPARIHRKS